MGFHKQDPRREKRWMPRQTPPRRNMTPKGSITMIPTKRQKSLSPRTQPCLGTPDPHHGHWRGMPNLVLDLGNGPSVSTAEGPWPPAAHDSTSFQRCASLEYPPLLIVIFKDGYLKKSACVNRLTEAATSFNSRLIEAPP